MRALIITILLTFCLGGNVGVQANSGDFNFRGMQLRSRRATLEYCEDPTLQAIPVKTTYDVAVWVFFFV